MPDRKNIVVHNGFRYDAKALPSGIDPKKCVPIDEWFRRNAKHKAVLEPTAGSDNHDSLTKAELADLLAERGIDVDPKATKADLIAALGADDDHSNEAPEGGEGAED